MTAETTWEAWKAKTLLLLVGKNKPFEDGFHATVNVNWDTLRVCWEQNMSQYEAAEYYQQIHCKIIDMKPREWLQQRRENMKADGAVSDGVVPCQMFTNRSSRKVSISTLGYCSACAFMAGVGIGVLIMYLAYWL